MHVCSCQGYGGLSGDRDEGGGLYACGPQTAGVVRMSGDAGILPECEVTH